LQISVYAEKNVSRADLELSLHACIQLADAIFTKNTDEFHARVANKPDEIKPLLETGFEFVCEKDELLYFRKRR